MLKDITSLILTHTRPTRAHLTPEIALRLVTSQCKLWTARPEEVPFEDPFWAFYWPGGQAMARYILDNGDEVKDRRIVDIGCGCGAGVIAAKMRNAKSVLANDIDPVAITATTLNAELNGITDIKTCTNNLIGKKLGEIDTVLIGDMFYDEDFAKYLFEWLRNLAFEGKNVLLGDPGRHGLTSERRRQISPLARYTLPDITRHENNGFTHSTLWRVNK